ncbi:MAG: putative SOS response-associated peptidase YedK [Flavobacterium sp.]|jgi:putative SOS response-associated peptidase YedK
MCGRFNIISDPLTQMIMDIVNGVFEETPNPIDTRYNIAPTESVPVLLRTNHGGWQLKDMRWWLVPSWSKAVSSKYTMFNAKSETLTKSRAFSLPFERKRCIVPVSGYYEWTTEGGVKLPHLIQPASEGGFAFAGLWDKWHRGDQMIESCTIITGAAPNSMEKIHKRIPIHLDANEIDSWLSTGTSQKALLNLLSPHLRVPLSITPLSTYVSNARNKDERCIEPLGEPWKVH